MGLSERPETAVELFAQKEVNWKKWVMQISCIGVVKEVYAKRGRNWTCIQCVEREIALTTFL